VLARRILTVAVLLPAFAGAAVVSLTTLAVAWVAFHRAEFSFAENI